MKAEISDSFSKMENKHHNTVASLEHAHIFCRWQLGRCVCPTETLLIWVPLQKYLHKSPGTFKLNIGVITILNRQLRE